MCPFVAKHARRRAPGAGRPASRARAKRRYCASSTRLQAILTQPRTVLLLLLLLLCHARRTAGAHMPSHVPVPLVGRSTSLLRRFVRPCGVTAAGRPARDMYHGPPSPGACPLIHPHTATGPATQADHLAFAFAFAFTAACPPTPPSSLSSRSLVGLRL